MNRWSISRSWPLTIGLAAASLAYLTLVFFPRMKAIAELHDQARLKQDLIAQAVKIRPAIAEVRRELADTRRFVGAQRQRCPSEDRLAGVFGQLSQLTKDRQLATTRFEPQPAQPLQTLRRVPVALAVQGSFAAVTDLLAAVESLPTYVWIDELRLVEAESGEAVQGELTLAIFVDNLKKSD
jgi:Tfp pilus assembly protein PilO